MGPSIRGLKALRILQANPQRAVSFISCSVLVPPEIKFEGESPYAEFCSTLPHTSRFLPNRAPGNGRGRGTNIFSYLPGIEPARKGDAYGYAVAECLGPGLRAGRSVLDQR